MDKFLIEGGRPLSGRIRIHGSKNATLPMMAASLLTDQPVILHNVPKLSDIDLMCEILGTLGVESTRKDGTLTLQTTDESNSVAEYDLVSRMRASVCALGPLVGRRGYAKVSLPGGCVIGTRPIDLHLKGLASLGTQIRTESGYVIAKAPRLTGSTMYLGGAFGSSVTGTANVLMAAVLAEGTTQIEHAACEPEVQELARMLQHMGARIEGVGTHRLVVQGVRELGGTEHTVIPDRMEAGTFMIAAAVSGGDVTLENVRGEDMIAVLETLDKSGVHIDLGSFTCRIVSNGMFRPVDIVTLPYPGFPTDLQAQTMAMLTLADGISVVTEKVYPDRFMHVAELARMGAELRKQGNAVVIKGVKKLHGAPVMASDLRASAALVIAGLAASGTTEITRVYHIDRGYQNIEKRLNALGARIRRVLDKKLIVVGGRGA
ncbi:MAG: UDP-N-acetylglucosamine 1-carboxyvinyltransferase [Planctomycetota bacterium]|jgi:UDP-N-acetylglucosamine 1-carboxyvinyltransferase